MIYPKKINTNISEISISTGDTICRYQIGISIFWLYRSSPTQQHC